MTSLDYQGHLFDEQTDWLAFIRDAINGRSTSGLRDDVPDVNSALAQLAEDLEGTDLRTAYCDALMTIIETGSDWERDRVRNLPYEDAPRAHERMLQLLIHQREMFRRDDWIGSFLMHLLHGQPDDPRALALVREEVEKPTRTSSVLELAARYQSRWFNACLPTLGLTPNGHEIVMWLKVSQERLGLMDALVASGPPFLEALDRRLHEPRTSPSAREQFREDFAQHPAFAGIVK